MKFSMFNIYIIVLIIWFIYNFIKKRKAILERQKRKEEEYREFTKMDNNSSDDEGDILRKLRDVVEGKNIDDTNSSSEYYDEDEYIEPLSTTSKQKDEEMRLQEERKAILERQRMYEEFERKSAIINKAKEDSYDYSINKRKAISIFKSSHEDLRKAIVYNAILERRGKKIR